MTTRAPGPAAEGPLGRVLVTGATGMVGRRLVRDLSDRGGSVRVLVRSRERLRNAIGSASGRIEVVEGDLAEPDSLTACCAGVDTVFHCARASLDTAARGAAAEAFERVDVRGTVALAEEGERAGARRFVYVSSTAAMGAPREALVDETTPCRPENPYQRAKREAELRLLELAGRTALEVVIVRPCLVAGEGKTGGELLKLFRLCRRGRSPWSAGGRRSRSRSSTSRISRAR